MFHIINLKIDYVEHILPKEHWAKPTTYVDKFLIIAVHRQFSSSAPSLAKSVSYTTFSSRLMAAGLLFTRVTAGG